MWRVGISIGLGDIHPDTLSSHLPVCKVVMFYSERLCPISLLLFMEAKEHTTGKADASEGIKLLKRTPCSFVDQHPLVHC